MQYQRMWLFWTFLFCLVSPLPVEAQDRGDQPWRGELAATGTLLTGNLNQLQLLGRAHLSYSTAKLGNDLILTGLSMWMKPNPSADFVRIGQDLSATDIPFYYVHPQLYAQGFARVESSQIHKLELRLNGGFGLGVAPVRRPELLFRLGLVGLLEHTRYPVELLTLGEKGPTRTVPRAVVVSNGWYRMKGSPVSLRYVANFMINPTMWQDLRYMADVGLDFRMTSHVALRTSLLTTHDSVVPEGVVPTDVRLTLGLVMSLTPTAP
ncbi:MAG: DUF481 domain-containing protein [Myxococcota bacterium]